MPLLVVNAADIDVAGLSIDVTLPESWVDAELGEADVHAVAPGKVVARLSRSGEEIVVRGRVRAEVTTSCARCLAPAPVHVDTELSLLLRPATEPEGKKREPEYEFDPNEADHDTYDGEQVILDSFVREAILLEMPSFPLCKEDCTGIEAAVTGQRNGGEQPAAIDPRLAPLAALSAKMKGEEPPPPAGTPAPRKKRAVLPVAHARAKRTKAKKN